MVWQLFSPERLALAQDPKNWKIPAHESVAKELEAKGILTFTNNGGIIAARWKWGDAYSQTQVSLQQIPQNCGALIAHGTDYWSDKKSLHRMDAMIKNIASQLGDKVVFITGDLTKVKGYTENCEHWTMGLETTSSRKHYTKKMGYACLDIPKELMAKSGY